MRSFEDRSGERDKRDERDGWDQRDGDMPDLGDIRDQGDRAADDHGTRRPAARREAAQRGAVAVLAAATALGAAACAGPPAGGTASLKPLSQSHNNVVIVARAPDSDMDPGILVTNFLQALTGDQKDPTFSVAQDYLTDDARKTWTAPTGGQTRTIIVKNLTPPSERPPGGGEHATRPPPAPDASSPVGTQTTLYQDVTEVAQLDQFGFYQADAKPTQQALKFTLRKEKAGWRIQELPTERVISLDSFKRVYQTNQSALPIYLPGSGDLAVDQVYLTQASGKPEYTFNALAEAVLHGRTQVQASAVQPDPARPVTLNSQGVAVVTLKVPPGTSAADLDAAQTALVRTFGAAAASTQLVGSTPQLQKVQVTYDGCTSVACTPHEVSAPVSGAPPTVYWACPADANGRSTVVSRQPSPGSTTVCGDPAHTVMTLNEPLAKNSPIAVRQPTDPSQHKPQTVYVAVVVKKGDGTGAVVVTDKRNANEHITWYTAADPSKVTDLEWDPVDGSLWVVDNHSLVRVRDPGDKPAGPNNQDQVDVPSDARLTGFKPSPDGTRAVLVTDAAAFGNGSAAPWPAAIVAIARGTGVPALPGAAVPLLADQTMGQPTSGVLARATDAAWADGRTVVMIGVSPNSNSLSVFKVYSDGSQDSLISDPGDAQPAASHISAATNVLNGRAIIWIFSDGAGRDGTGSSVYFKSRSSAEGYQDNGWCPVVATTSPDTGS